MSGPLLDRIDVRLEVPPVPARELARARQQSLLRVETDAVRARVVAARALQIERAKRLGVSRLNVRLTPAELERAAPLDPSLRSFLGDAVAKLGLSARGYHRVWRLAQTIADLEGRETVGREAMAEALMLREVQAG